METDEQRRNEEIYTVCLALLMGIVRKPTIQSYWATDILMCSPFFSREESLTRDRFLQILRFIRFADYSRLEENDVLKKIRPFIDKVRLICKTSYQPSKYLSVDETLLLFRGRFLFKQYIPSKRARYGVKTFALCESQTGYFFNFETYVTQRHIDFGEFNELPFSTKMVLHLSQPLFHLGHHIVTDNFFTSESLAAILFSKGTYFTGTWREKRGVPSVLRSLQMEAFESAFARKGPLLCSKFVDRKQSGLKNIYILDTEDDAGTIPVTRVRKGGREEVLDKPTTIFKYNTKMGGVDRSDSLMQRYDVTRKSLNWMTKYGLHLIQRLVMNAHVAYSSDGGRQPFLKFLLIYIERTMVNTGKGRNTQIRGRPTKMLKIGHQPVKVPSTATRPRPTKRCRMCHKEGARKESRYMCPDCPGNPGLCIDPCFRNFKHC